MSRKREATLMGLGVLTGLALCDPANATIQQLTATPTSQTFYVNGRHTQFEAYEIHGNNFVKLRDVGKAVDFGVIYDAATNSVYIDTDAPYCSAYGGPYGTSVSNCAGWAILCSDAVFGDSPWRKINSPRWEDIRVGDLIQYDNDMGGHAIIVTDKTADTLTYTDSGPSSKVYWGSQVPRWWLEQRPGLVLYTRYPQ